MQDTINGLEIWKQQEWLKLNEIIEAVAVEEKPIDRAYNAKGQKRQTHLEVMGGRCLCSSQWQNTIYYSGGQ